MGADITEENPAEQGGEPVADLVGRYAPLKGARIPEALVPDMIDEFPALFVAAAAAEGQTVVTGAAELRVKESIALRRWPPARCALGMQVDETEDGALHGGVRLGSGTIESHGDHRIAMAFAIAGQDQRWRSVHQRHRQRRHLVPGFRRSGPQRRVQSGLTGASSAAPHRSAGADLGRHNE
jgi:5-enolpyruvylshikimate-3-phosphate synthase